MSQLKGASRRAQIEPTKLGNSTTPACTPSAAVNSMFIVRAMALPRQNKYRTRGALIKLSVFFQFSIAN